MKPLEQQAKQLLEYLWRGGQWGYFWTLDRATSQKRTHWLPVEKLGLVPNGKTDVYFSVNPTAKPKDQYHRALIGDVSALNCLFAEFDAVDFGRDKSKTLEHVHALRPVPSVIIDSGGGYHCYWLLRETFAIDSDQEREYIRGVLSRWVDFVGGDVVKDIARVLRVPGTHNYKPDYGPQPPMVFFVGADFERQYSLVELVKLLPLPEAQPQAQTKTTVNLDDYELLNKIRNSKQGAKFAALFDRGDISDYQSHSEADAGLCSILIGWAGGDTSRADRLFRQSALFRADKWDDARHGGTYGSITLEYALSKATWFYDPQKNTTSPTMPEEPPWDYPEAAPPEEAFYYVPEPEKVENKDTSPGWRWLTLADAYADRPPRDYVIEKLLPIPSLTSVYGSPGGLKTMLVMDMAMSVIAQQPFLDPMPGMDRVSPFNTSGGAVMWIDVDNGERRSLDRMKALGQTRDLPDDAPFYFVSFPTPPFIASKQDSIDFIIENVTLGNIKLVVFDNLGTISGGADENSNEMVGVMSGLRQIAERGQCAVVVIHHRNKGNGLATRKGNALRGHSSIEGALDLALLVNREEGEDVITIESTKTRDIPVWPFEAMWTYTQDEEGELIRGRFWGLGRPEKDDDAKPANERAYEYIVISLDETKSQSDIVTMCKAAKMGRNATLTALEQLEREKITEVSRGDRNAKMYTLTPVGRLKQREILYNR